MRYFDSVNIFQRVHESGKCERWTPDGWVEVKPEDQGAGVEMSLENAVVRLTYHARRAGLSIDRGQARDELLKN